MFNRSMIVTKNKFSTLFKKSFSSGLCSVRDRGQLFKQDLKKGVPKIGLFVNSASPTVAEQLPIRI